MLIGFVRGNGLGENVGIQHTKNTTNKKDTIGMLGPRIWWNGNDVFMVGI